MQDNCEVMKYFVITLMVLGLVFGFVGDVNGVNVGTGKNVGSGCEDFRPITWGCGNIINNRSNILNQDYTALFGENIQYRLLVLDKNGLNKLQNFFGYLINPINSSDKIYFNCSIDDVYNQKNFIDPLCNASIVEQKVTVFDGSVMRYYTCDLNVKDSSLMKGLYSSYFESNDLSGCIGPGTYTDNKNWSINPTIFNQNFLNPEAIINMIQSQKI